MSQNINVNEEPTTSIPAEEKKLIIYPAEEAEDILTTVNFSFLHSTHYVTISVGTLASERVLKRKISEFRTISSLTPDFKYPQPNISLFLLK